MVIPTEKRDDEMKVRKKDGLLIGGLLCLGLFFLLWTYLRQQEDRMVQVRVDGVCQKNFLLSDDVTYEIQGIDGTNTLRIANEQVWLTEADCPDKVCVQTGKISYVGQSIICLPHRVVVEIVEEDGTDEK